MKVFLQTVAVDLSAGTGELRDPVITEKTAGNPERINGHRRLRKHKKCRALLNRTF